MMEVNVGSEDMKILYDFVNEKPKKKVENYDLDVFDNGRSDYAPARYEEDEWLGKQKEEKPEFLVDDFDFSDIKGDLKGSLKKIKKRRALKNFGVKKSATIVAKEGVIRTTNKIIIPKDRKIIIEGVENFITQADEKYKQIGYYKGNKLKELILIFNNDSTLDFTVDLFSPSFINDYMVSNTGDINNKIDVEGGSVTYRDLVAYMCGGNSTYIHNGRFVFEGSNISNQASQPLTFNNRNIEGDANIHPINPRQFIDIYQYQSNIVLIDIDSALNRPFIPDGLDSLQYKVLAGMTVTFCFYFEIIKLKEFFYNEARKSKILL